MIGYYVHHQGHGHVHRAVALTAELDEAVTGLSSLPRPHQWRGDWLVLDRDDAGDGTDDPTARGRLHWVPAHDVGLSRRMAQLATWLDATRPRLVIVDVSVEVTLLARLHGIPVLGVVLPGRRDDAAHRLGQDVSDVLVGFWPPSATEGLLPGVHADVLRRVLALGAVSRFPVARKRTRRPGPSRVVVLCGTGGSDFDTGAIERVAGWEWTMLGPTPGSWHNDPRPLIEDADVVVTHAGQNALAEVAAARRPAVVVPQPRPHDEQLVTARLLRSGPWPVIVEDQLPRHGWGERLARAAARDGEQWAEWCDGNAGQRFAEATTW